MQTGIFVQGRKWNRGDRVEEPLDAFHRVNEHLGRGGRLSDVPASDVQGWAWGDRVGAQPRAAAVMTDDLSTAATDVVRGGNVLDFSSVQSGLGADGRGFAFASRPAPAAGAGRPMVELDGRSAAPAPGAGRRYMGDGDLDGDGIPDGAEVTRTVESLGAGGEKVKETANWIHKRQARPSERSAREMMDPFDRLALVEGENSRDTFKQQRATQIRDRYAREAMEGIQVGEANANRARDVEVARQTHGAPAEVRAAGDADERAFKREGLAEQRRQFDAKMAEQPKVMTGANGQQYVSYNGQMLKLDPPGADGVRMVRNESEEGEPILGVWDPVKGFQWKPTVEGAAATGGSLLSELDAVFGGGRGGRG